MEGLIHLDPTNINNPCQANDKLILRRLTLEIYDALVNAVSGHLDAVSVVLLSTTRLNM